MKKALILVADGSEEMEAITVIDVLRRAGIDVTVASVNGLRIVASRGVRIVADCSFDDAATRRFDVLILPGGAGGTSVMEGSSAVIESVRRAYRQGWLLAAICAAPRVLQAAGVLSNRRVTSYPGALDSESSEYHYVEEPVVDDGQIVTSRGPGTALDFALHLVERLEGYGARRKVEDPLVRPR